MGTLRDFFWEITLIILDKGQFYISKNDYVTVKKTGNFVTMIALDKRSRGGSIKKLNKDEYVNTITGEVSKFKHNETRRDNKRELLRTFSKLRDIINTNVTNPENCKWITLTYKENMQDTQRLYKDIDKFNKKLRYVYGHYEYIIVIEPQERGAWHAHCIIIFPDKAPYMPNANVAELWSNGFTQTKALQNIDNIGAYLTAYLTDSCPKIY